MDRSRGKSDQTLAMLSNCLLTGSVAIVCHVTTEDRVLTTNPSDMVWGIIILIYVLCHYSEC